MLAGNEAKHSEAVVSRGRVHAGNLEMSSEMWHQAAHALSGGVSSSRRLALSEVSAARIICGKPISAAQIAHSSEDLMPSRNIVRPGRGKICGGFGNLSEASWRVSTMRRMHKT